MLDQLFSPDAAAAAAAAADDDDDDALRPSPRSLLLLIKGGRVLAPDATPLRARLRTGDELELYAQIPSRLPRGLRTDVAPPNYDPLTGNFKRDKPPSDDDERRPPSS